MAKPKSEIWAIVHDEALQRFNAIEGNLRDERMASLAPSGKVRSMTTGATGRRLR